MAIVTVAIDLAKDLLSVHGVVTRTQMSVVPFAWHQVPNPSSGILHIRQATGYQMRVAMKHALTSILAAVHADVESSY